MSLDLPPPPVPADSDLRDFPFTPIYRARLFGSSFHARANDAEWRAGVTLWLKSWDQTPAGSLPDDDIELCRLAELARDLKTWKKVKTGALHGWYKCSDGRLYHKVVAEGITEAVQRKEAQREKTARARLAALQKRLSDAKDEDTKARITEEIRRLSQSLSQTPKTSVTDRVTDPVTASITESNRQGQGQGQGLINNIKPLSGKPDDLPPDFVDPATPSQGEDDSQDPGGGPEVDPAGDGNVLPGTDKAAKDAPKKAERRQKASELLAYLNEKTGHKYRPVDGTLKPIIGRLNEGFTVDECKSVIDAKVKAWRGDPKMEQFLRPETLFKPEKFAGYAGQLPANDGSGVPLTAKPLNPIFKGVK